MKYSVDRSILEYCGIIPIIQFYLSFLSVFIPFNFNYSDSVGYSLLTGIIYYVLFCINKKSNIVIRHSVYGLILLNIVSFIGTNMDYNLYSVYYDSAIFIFIHIKIFLTLLYNVRKNKNT